MIECSCNIINFLNTQSNRVCSLTSLCVLSIYGSKVAQQLEIEKSLVWASSEAMCCVL